MPDKKRIRVAIGIILDEANKVLIGLRKQGQHLEGLWEFPGGKVLAGEPVAEALSRELKEEVGIVPCSMRPFKVIDFDYADRMLELHFWLVSEFQGIPTARESQELRWITLDALGEFSFPEANDLVIRELQTSNLSGG